MRAVEEEWHMVELWGGSPCLPAGCRGAEGCSRSRLSQLEPRAGFPGCKGAELLTFC